MGEQAKQRWASRQGRDGRAGKAEMGEFGDGSGNLVFGDAVELKIGFAGF